MTTNAVNGAGGSATTTQITPSNLGQQDFLRLMVAQIQNQDPLQPQVNGEFLSQLAQFSTNDGVNKMQESMQQMANSLQSNQALQASALVGRKVLVASDALTLEKDGDAKTGIDVPPGATNLVAYIYNDAGELVKTMNLGSKEAGFVQFPWDGSGQDGKRLNEGRYRVSVHGTYMGQEVAFKTMTTANVDSVSLGQNGEGLRLNVAGVGAVGLDQVRQITV
ncbi:MAG: flagellar biosynthesis protein FlgD [Legionella sp. 40-6]|nr:flagellar hook assembly protein FlgD [Legionella sp.]OJY20640.1 MAG: flagellar biosynthesis protein FlgD [Legionella sp. 40-6]